MNQSLNRDIAHQKVKKEKKKTGNYSAILTCLILYASFCQQTSYNCYSKRIQLFMTLCRVQRWKMTRQEYDYLVFNLCVTFRKRQEVNKDNSIIITQCSHFNAFIMYSSLSGPFHSNCWVDSECHQYSATALYCIMLIVSQNDSSQIITT